MIPLPHWPIHTGFSHHNSPELMQKILQLLGNPHKKITNIIHVAGTNGKGSTIAFMSSILRSAGHSCNTYTSPHIFHFTERFNINGENAKHDEVFNALEEVRAVCEEHSLQPTVLEVSTIVAFLLFAKHRGKYNIIECCMGGLYDNTNILEHQNLACTVITSISLDHTQYLGNTIAEITFHKAGIQKAGVPSIIARQKYEDASTLLFNYAQKFNIPATFYGQYTIEKIEIDGETFHKMKQDGINICDGASLLYNDETHKDIFLPYPPLLGEHQLENLATAVRAMFLLGITPNSIVAGIIKTQWAGRLQRVFNNQFPQNWQVWFDGAHNPDGAKALADWVYSTKTEMEDVIIIGKSKGANQSGFIAEFSKCNARIFFVTVRGEVFPETAENLAKTAKSIGVDGTAISVINNLHLPDSKNYRIICCGSLYLLKDLESYKNT